MLKLFCLVTGDEYKQILNETPASKKKVRLMAISLFIPVILWAVNSYLLACEILKCSQFTSLLIMIISASIIFVIEKAIIMSNGSKVIAGFRISLGITIALLGSIAFDEVIFKNDIDTQMAENKTEYIKRGLDKKKQDLGNEIMKYEITANEKCQEWMSANTEAIKESDGTGGSGVPNRGKITDLKLKKADELKLEYENARVELNDKKAITDSTINSHELYLDKSYNENSILLRIEALFDLVNKDGWMKLVYILFTFLIILLESMVIIVKLFSKETNYERKVKLIEEIGEKRMKLIRENNYSVFDQVIFKDNLGGSTNELMKPVKGMFN